MSPPNRLITYVTKSPNILSSANPYNLLFYWTREVSAEAASRPGRPAARPVDAVRHRRRGRAQRLEGREDQHAAGAAAASSRDTARGEASGDAGTSTSFDARGGFRRASSVWVQRRRLNCALANLVKHTFRWDARLWRLHGRLQRGGLASAVSKNEQRHRMEQYTVTQWFGKHLETLHAAEIATNG